jgi:ParB/RepB/Spo0J family partition protein
MNSPINFTTAGVSIATVFPDGSLHLLGEKGETIEKYDNWVEGVKMLSGEEIAAPGPKYGSKAMLTMLQKATGAEDMVTTEVKSTEPTEPGKKATKAARSTAKVTLDSGEEVVVSGTTIMVDPDDIIAGPNPRGKTPDAEGMAQSMRDNAKVTGQALIQNIVAGLPVNQKGRAMYPLMAGWTRWEGAKLNKASYPNKPEFWMLRATIFDVAEDERAALGLMENLRRVDMNPVARARSWKNLIDGQNWQQKDISKRFGFSAAQVSNILSILTLPKPILKLGEDGKIDQTWLVNLVKMNPEDQKVAFATIQEDIDAGTDPLTRKVKEAIKEAHRGAKADAAGGSDTAGGGDEGDTDETPETPETPAKTKLSRGEIITWLEDNHLPGADPAMFAISEIMLKVYAGERTQGWGVKQISQFKKVDGSALPNTGVVSKGRKPKADAATA